MAKRISKPTVVLGILVVILTLVGGFFSYRYWQATQNNPEQRAKSMLSHVSSITEVPQEKPTIATIADTTKLGNELLRQRSQNGDKLLIYQKAKRMILYRPSSKKIIETLTIQDRKIQ